MAARQTVDPLLRRLGARLAEIRRDRRMTQEQLAEVVAVDVQTIQRAENGRVSLSLSRLETITSALGVELDVVFQGVGQLVPTAPWAPDEVRVVALWRQVPEERWELALRVLRDFGQ